MKKLLSGLCLLALLAGCSGKGNETQQENRCQECSSLKTTSASEYHSDKINNDVNGLIQNQNIWLIRLEDSPKNIEEILIKDHYLPIYDDKENTLFINNLTINYLSIDWDVCSVKFANNISVSISFSRISPVAKKSEKISHEKMSKLKSDLSIKFGEMREVRMDEDKDTKIYRWYGGNYIIELTDMFNGDMIVLSFFKDGYNPRISEN